MIVFEESSQTHLEVHGYTVLSLVEVVFDFSQSFLLNESLFVFVILCKNITVFVLALKKTARKRVLFNLNSYILRTRVSI